MSRKSIQGLLIYVLFVLLKVSCMEETDGSITMKPKIITAYVNRSLNITATVEDLSVENFLFMWFINGTVCDDFNSTNCLPKLPNYTVTGKCRGNNSMTLTILNITEWYFNKEIECRVYPTRHSHPYFIRKPILEPEEAINVLLTVNGTKIGHGAERLAVENETLNFTCVARGRPAPVISWYKVYNNSKEKVNNSIVTSTVTQESIYETKSVLMYKFTREDHDKMVYCSSKTFRSTPVRSTNATLKVKYPPYIEFLANQNAQEGFNISVTCQVKPGYPNNTSIQWLSPRDVGILSNTRFLFVENVTQSNTGKYTCVASNTDFNTTRSFVLYINDLQTITPYGDCTLTNCSSSNTTTESKDIPGRLNYPVQIGAGCGLVGLVILMVTIVLVRRLRKSGIRAQGEERNRASDLSYQAKIRLRNNFDNLEYFGLNLAAKSEETSLPSLHRKGECLQTDTTNIYQNAIGKSEGVAEADTEDQLVYSELNFDESGNVVKPKITRKVTVYADIDHLRKPPSFAEMPIRDPSEEEENDIPVEAKQGRFNDGDSRATDTQVNKSLAPLKPPRRKTTEMNQETQNN